MSLLCVACALLCAVFLDGGAYASDKFVPWEQDAFFFGLCRTEHIGYRTRKILTAPEVKIPPEKNDYDLFISDLCKTLGLELVGLVVTVCDADAQPSLMLTSVNHGLVRRLSSGTAAATCYTKEFCS